MKPNLMSTQHIRNRIDWIRRECLIDPWSIHGDEPEFGADGLVDTMVSESNDRWEAHVAALERELITRLSEENDSRLHAKSTARNNSSHYCEKRLDYP